MRIKITLDEDDINLVGHYLPDKYYNFLYDLLIVLEKTLGGHVVDESDSD